MLKLLVEATIVGLFGVLFLQVLHLGVLLLPSIASEIILFFVIGLLLLDLRHYELGLPHVFKLLLEHILLGGNRLLYFLRGLLLRNLLGVLLFHLLLSILAAFHLGITRISWDVLALFEL